MSVLVDTANLDLASTPNQAPPPEHLASAAPPPRPQPHAIPTAQRARKVNGIHTDVVLQVFQDRVLVIVTQLGRIGAMIQVTAPPSALTALPPPPPPPHPSSSSSSTTRTVPRAAPHPSTLLTPLFGAAPSPHIASLHDLYALHVGAAVFARLGAAGEGAQRPVVLGIGLKRAQKDGAARLGGGDDDDDEAGVSEAEKETFEQVLDMVVECLG
ncbi:hypothetical protein JCM8208_001089 [Rhodotorula glutinis]